MTSHKEATDKNQPKITGVGGIFYFTENPEATKNWYAQHFGVPTDEYGATFITRSIEHENALHRLQWAPFPKDSTYFKPSTKDFMINYTVQHIELLVEKLKKEGVEVLDEIAVYEYGKFVHVLDLDGNKIELWEPQIEQ